MKNPLTDHIQSNAPDHFRASLLTAILFSVLWQNTMAGTKTWDGSASSSWNNPNNWVSGNGPVDGDDLVFPANATRFTITNNISGLSLNSITFSGSNYLVRGNAITLTNGIAASYSSGTSTNEIAIQLDAAQTINCTNLNTDLILNGNITNNGHLLTVTGDGTTMLSGVISGAGGLTQNSVGGLQLGGSSANAYTGDTTVNAGVLLLAKPAGSAITSGQLIIGNGSASGIVRYLANNQISAGVDILVNSAGLLDLNSFSDTVGSITLVGGRIDTGTGTLAMNANLTATSVGPHLADITGNLNLGSSTRTFTVTNGPGTPDLSVGATVVGTGGITKTGGGRMFMTGSNSFSGPVTVDDGTWAQDGDFAAGTTAGGVTVNNNAVLELLNNVHVGNEPLTLNSTATNGALFVSGGSNSWAGTVTLSIDTNVRVESVNALNLLGQITGAGGLTKSGVGTLYYSGSSSNNYAGVTIVNAGTLVLAKSVDNGALTNDLVIGDGLGGANADVVQLQSGSQLPNTVAVTVNSSGLFDVNDIDEAFGSLAGSGNVTLGSAIINPGYDNTSTTFSGVMTGTGRLNKSGTGTMTLSGTNTYTGATTVIDGTLLVYGPQPQSAVTVSANGTLGGTGTVGQVTVNGNLAPGASPGILTTSNLTFSSVGDYAVELNGSSPGTGYDQVKVSGTNNLAGATLNLSVSGFTPAPGQVFTIVSNDLSDAITGTFAGLPEGTVFSADGFIFQISYVGGSGNDVTLLRTNPPSGDRFWVNPLGGNYQVATNWLDNFVPRPQDNANFTNNASYQVNWTSDAAAANAFFNASSGTVTQPIGAFSWLLTNSYVVGQNAGSTATVTHASGTLRVTNSAGTGVLEVRRGTNQFNAGLIDTDFLLLTNTAGEFVFNGGTLITRGGIISNLHDFNVGASGSTPAIWDVRAGSDVLLSSDLAIGHKVSGCQFFLTNGGKVFGGGGVIGDTSPADSNAVFVTGAGSIWSNSTSLGVGLFGSFNQLVVSKAGAVFGSSASIGAGNTSASNEVLITDPGSVWSNRASLHIGGGPGFNRLVVSNGGALFNNTATIAGVVIGDSSSTSNNQVLVTGAGSVWSNGSAMYVGDAGSFNQLVVSNGGKVFNSTAAIGFGSSNNAVFVVGPNSVLSNSSSLTVGDGGNLNQLVVSNGGNVFNLQCNIGGIAGVNSNTVLVTGPGSTWVNGDSARVGSYGSFNRLMISNGAMVRSFSGIVGFDSTANSNSVLVTGAGSVWSNQTFLDVGGSGSFSQLVVSNGGTTIATSFMLGVISSSTNNRSVVDGGALRVTNASTTGKLEIRRGTNQLSNGGLIETDRLLVTNTLGLFEFNGGTLNVRTSSVGNAQTFFAGNGTSPSTLNLVGNGTHSFTNGLTLRSNATLIGNGTISGVMTVQLGGSVSPGTSVGKIILNSAPVLQGAVVMEISKNGSLLTNDQIQVSGTVTYGGTLTVTNIGPDVLVLGNRFPLFSAGNFAGSFSRHQPAATWFRADLD